MAFFMVTVVSIGLEGECLRGMRDTSSLIQMVVDSVFMSIVSRIYGQFSVVKKCGKNNCQVSRSWN